MTDWSPSELILQRSRAFARGDFALIYDTYHSASLFRQQFPEREDYVRVGQESLARDFQITGCEILAEKVEDGEAQVIFLLEMRMQGHLQKFAERAWLRRENRAWRYHRGQKITAEELPEAPEQLTFADFAKLDPATIF